MIKFFLVPVYSRTVNFLAFEEKERVNDVRFAKKNVLPTSDSLLLAKMHVAKTLFAVALPNFGLVTS